MHRNRFVLRRADPGDRRVSLISLSEKGRRTMLAVQLARQERIETLLRQWTARDRLELGRLLAIFNEALSLDIAQTTSGEGSWFVFHAKIDDATGM